MRWFASLIFAAAACAPAAAAAQAASPAAADARCLMTMAAVSSAKDPNAAQVGQAGVLFFAGRVKAKDPTFDFGSRLKAVASSLQGQNMQAEAQRCGDMVVDALRELQAAQQSLGPPPGAAAPQGGAKAPPAQQTPPQAPKK